MLNNNDLKTEILYETQGCLLNNILGVLSVPSYLVRPNGLLNLLPPCVHGKAEQIVGADSEQLLRLLL